MSAHVIEPVGSNLINNPDLSSAFEEYLQDARELLLKKLQSEEKKCMSQHGEDPENYAKCMHAFQKDMKDNIMNLNFKTTFLKKKIEECMSSPIYKTNMTEGTKYCLKNAKQMIDKLIKSI